MLKVCKFGGSSLSSVEEFRKVRSILESDPDRKIVVVSAMGKRNKEDNKVTDLLYLVFQHAKYHVDFHSLLREVESRYLEIEKELHLNTDLAEEFSLLAKRIQNNDITEEELVSKGEYFSAKLMSAYIGYDFVDSRDLIHFGYDNRVNEEKTLKSIQDAHLKHERMVVSGFYGSYPNGNICLFTRGGSDVTGSYLAKGVKADLYENFTDVSGFLMADPRIVKNPKRIKEISYSELRELSFMGANVIHEETILPLQEDKIPLYILNTNHVEEGGTLIKENTPDKTHLITGITGKKGYIALTFVKKKNADKLHVILNVLTLLEEYRIPIEHLPTSIDSFSVVIEKSKIEGKYYDLLAKLKADKDILSISLDDDIALVAVIGRNMVRKPGTSGRILSCFGEEKINIKLIDQGREEINIIVGVSNNDFEKSIQNLYERFANEKI